MREATKKRVRLLSRIFFGFYILLLIYFMFFSEEWGRNFMGGEYQYNLLPFREIRRYLQHYRQIGGWLVLLNLAGNIFAFVPFGALLPVLPRRKVGFWKTVLLSLDLSLCIEVSQLILRAGSCDVDDIILNTLGGCAGYGLYMLAFWIKEKKVEKKV